MKSESRAVCLRFAPPTAGSGEGSPWSHPLEASFPIVADRHVAVPVQPPTPSQTAAPGTLHQMLCKTVFAILSISRLAVLARSCSYPHSSATIQPLSRAVGDRPRPLALVHDLTVRATAVTTKSIIACMACCVNSLALAIISA